MAGEVTHIISNSNFKRKEKPAVNENKLFHCSSLSFLKGEIKWSRAFQTCVIKKKSGGGGEREKMIYHKLMKFQTQSDLGPTGPAAFQHWESWQLVTLGSALIRRTYKRLSHLLLTQKPTHALHWSELLFPVLIWLSRADKSITRLLRFCFFFHPTHILVGGESNRYRGAGVLLPVLWIPIVSSQRSDVDNGQPGTGLWRNSK